MKDTRYKELREENNLLLNNLSGEYYRLGNIYIKKARGYAVKSVDTELKIADCLKILEDYSYRHVDYHSVISSDTAFIEENIQKLSKELNDPNRKKTIFALSLIVLFIIVWVIISIWMRKETPNEAPKNLKLEKVSNTEVVLSWDLVEFATEGYYVWQIDDDGNIYGKYHTLKLEYTFEIEDGKSYTFYIQTKKTELLAESSVVSIKYKNAQS